MFGKNLYKNNTFIRINVSVIFLIINRKELPGFEIINFVLEIRFLFKINFRSLRDFGSYIYITMNIEQGVTDPLFKNAIFLLPFGEGGGTRSFPRVPGVRMTSSFYQYHFLYIVKYKCIISKIECFQFIEIYSAC